MTLLVNFLNTVKDSFTAAFPLARQCELHSGDLNIDEIRQIAPQLPALLISSGAIGIKEPQADGTNLKPVTIVAYVITRDEAGLTRFESAANIAEALLELVDSNNFAFAGAREATDEQAKNLSTSGLEREKVAMWVVRWVQKLQFGQSFFDDGIMPTRLYVGMDPDTGADNINKYVEITNEQ